MPAVRVRPVHGSRTRPTSGCSWTGTGTVATWAWIDEPLRNHLLQEPFAWCLIRLDGADTDLLHAVRVPSKDQMRHRACGSQVRWRDERIGSIKDIECFEPEGAR